MTREQYITMRQSGYYDYPLLYNYYVNTQPQRILIFDAFVRLLKAYINQLGHDDAFAGLDHKFGVTWVFKEFEKPKEKYHRIIKII